MLKLFIKFKALKLRGFYVLRKCYKWKTYTNDLEILKHILMFEVIELLLLINDHFVISYQLVSEYKENWLLQYIVNRPDIVRHKTSQEKVTGICNSGIVIAPCTYTVWTPRYIKGYL